MAYVNGENRHQLTLMSEVIDDYITEENQLRFIDAFVETINTKGFKYGESKQTGRPSYNPADMLKLYIYPFFLHLIIKEPLHD